MSDYTPATLTVYGVAGKEAQIAVLLRDEDFGLDYGSSSAAAEDVIDGVTFVSDQASTNVIYNLGDAFENLGLSYSICQDARYEFNGVIRMHTPELGTFTGTATQDGSVAVEGYVLVDKVLSLLEEGVEAVPGYEGYEEVTFFNAETVLEATEVLERLTGVKWTRALAELAAQA